MLLFNGIQKNHIARGRKPLLKLSFIVLIVSALSGCMMTEEQTSPASKTGQTQAEITQKNNEIKALGKDMLALGDIPKEESKPTSELIANTSTTKQTVDQYQMFLTEQAAFKNKLTPADKQLYKVALRQMQEKNWQTAVKTFDELLGQQPSFTFAHINKALAYYYLAEPDLALGCIEKAEKFSVNNPYYYNVKGVLLRQQGQFIQAEKAYQQALTIWPEFADALLNAAVFYELYRGDFAQAKNHYQRYLTLKPDDQQTKKWLAGLEIKLATEKGS